MEHDKINKEFIIKYIENDEEKIYIIPYIKTNDNLYIKGITLAKFLKYSNCKQAITDNVDNDYIIEYKDLKELNSFENVNNKEDNPNTKYISELGIYEFLTKSKMSNAKLFKKWVFNTIKTINNEKVYILIQEKDETLKKFQETIIKNNKLFLENTKKDQMINELKVKAVVKYKHDIYFIIYLKDYRKIREFNVKIVQIHLLSKTCKYIRLKYPDSDIIYSNLNPNAKKIWNKMKEDRDNKKTDIIDSYYKNYFKVKQDTTIEQLIAFIDSYQFSSSSSSSEQSTV